MAAPRSRARCVQDRRARGLAARSARTPSRPRRRSRQIPLRAGRDGCHPDKPHDLRPCGTALGAALGIPRRPLGRARSTFPFSSTVRPSRGDAVLCCEGLQQGAPSRVPHDRLCARARRNFRSYARNPRQAKAAEGGSVEPMVLAAIQTHCVDLETFLSYRTSTSSSRPPEVSLAPRTALAAVARRWRVRWPSYITRRLLPWSRFPAPPLRSPSGCR